MDIENTNSSFINLKVVGKCGVLPATFSLEEDFMAEIVEFNGSKYGLKGKYYIKTTGVRTLLHRDVWEFYSNQKVPKGYIVHHIDGNKLNNKFNNLLCCSRVEHNAIHRGEFVANGRSEKHLEHLNRIRPKCNAWHSTPEGKKWHSEHAKRILDNLNYEPRECIICGETYKPIQNTQRFCCKRCKSKYNNKKQWERDKAKRLNQSIS